MSEGRLEEDTDRLLGVGKGAAATVAETSEHLVGGVIRICRRSAQPKHEFTCQTADPSGSDTMSHGWFSRLKPSGTWPSSNAAHGMGS